METREKAKYEDLLFNIYELLEMYKRRDNAFDMRTEIFKHSCDYNFDELGREILIMDDDKYRKHCVSYKQLISDLSDKEIRRMSLRGEYDAVNKKKSI